MSLLYTVGSYCIIYIYDVLTWNFFFNLNFLRNEGHTTMSCPHRVATEYGVTPASHRNAGNPVEYVFERQLRPNMPHVSVIFFYILNCHYSVYLISA